MKSFAASHLNEPTDKRGGAHNRKLGDVHLEFLEERLGENCFLTLREMQDLLLVRFGVEVTGETVRANLDAHCFTVKKIHRDNNYRNTPENKLKRQQFAINLLQFVAEDKKILYLDETNFNLWVSRNFGWSAKGKRAVDLNTSSKGRNIHVIACISREGVEYSEGRFRGRPEVARASRLANPATSSVLSDSIVRSHQPPVLSLLCSLKDPCSLFLRVSLAHYANCGLKDLLRKLLDLSGR
jgi:hypothetical protein